MRVTHAALVWVFGVAATFLGVGSLGQLANPHDSEHVQAASTVTASAPTNPVRQLEAPVPAIQPSGVDLDVAIQDMAGSVTPAPIVAEPGVRSARAPPATARA